jgi:hypothetical protein
MHQQFVDDNLLMGHPSVQEARIFNRILRTFSDASRTTINHDKSHIFFFNTPIITQQNIARILGFSISSLPTKYLGSPLINSAIKHSSWHDILDKLEWKLTSWNFRSINIVGRLILIKAVLQSMPLYLFSVLASPKWVLKAI